MDSDDEEDDEDSDVVCKYEEVGLKENNKDLLSPEDAERQGELAEGVRKIKVRLQSTKATKVC